MALPRLKLRLARGLKLVFLFLLILFFLALARLAAAQPANPGSTPADYTAASSYDALLEIINRQPHLADSEFIRTAVPIQLVTMLSQSHLRLNGKMLDEQDSWALIPVIYSLNSTPARLASGQALYAYGCAQCHGSSGTTGDPEMVNLASLAYWGNRSDRAVYERLLADTAVPAHTFTLEPDQAWLLIEAMRHFSFSEMDALGHTVPAKTHNAYKTSRQLPAADSPITISGYVQNGTANGRIAAETAITLRAYDSSYTLAQTYTTTLAPDGTFTFTLDKSDLQDDWVYLASVSYQGVEYTSDIGQISPDNPPLSLPITVYDATSDPTAVHISQLHISLTFAGDQLQVNELYSFANGGTAVFVGENGRPAEGTLQINLPQDAANPTFERGLGSDRFLPADEFKQKEGAWYDTLPLRPGASSQTILVRYSLPYGDGTALNHTLPYAADELFLALPDRGVTLQAEGWTQQETRSAGSSGVILTYARSNVPVGSQLDILLQGNLQPANGRNVAPSSSQIGQWIIAAGVLLFGLYLLWRMVNHRRQKKGTEVLGY